MKAILLIVLVPSILFATEACVAKAEKALRQIERTNGFNDFEISGHESPTIEKGFYLNEKVENYQFYGSQNSESRVYEIKFSLPKCRLIKFELVEVE